MSKTMSTMKLFYVPGVCSMASHIILNETGLSHEEEKVDPKNKVVKEGNYVEKINPKGYVPALKLTNGEVLTEGVAIMQYLADQKPEMHLSPREGTFERYRLMEMMNYLATEIHKGYGQLWNPKAPAEIHDNIKLAMAKKFDYLSGILKKNDFLMGSRFTIADAYLFTVLRWTKKLGIDLSKWPVLMGYSEKIQIRPAVQKTLQTEGLL